MEQDRSQSGGSRFGAVVRVCGAALVGLAMLLLPTVLWSIDKPKAHLVPYAVLGLAMLAACPLVFQLLAGWRHGFRSGAIFALVVAAGLAVYFIRSAVPKPVGVGTGIYGGVIFFVVFSIPGLFGAWVASLIGGEFDNREAETKGPHPWAWLIGATLAVIELAASALLILLWK